MNSTYALWTWHRNQDIYGENSEGDQIYIVRRPELCLAKGVVSSEVLHQSHGSLQVPLLWKCKFHLEVMLLCVWLLVKAPGLWM